MGRHGGGQGVVVARERRGRGDSLEAKPYKNDPEILTVTNHSVAIVRILKLVHIMINQIKIVFVISRSASPYLLRKIGFYV